MNNTTVQYRRTLRGSVGAGVSALFNGNGRRYYILEHKDASRYHQAGESQKIIVDQVELGRDSNCQVRFDDSFETVSRKHAAIVKDGDRWKIIPLSQTNSTLVNGRPIQGDWYLENGDEIQLSHGGPKLGFIVPAGNQSLVSSIKMTERLELFRKQALKPYKTAIAWLSAILIISVVGLGTWNIVEHKKWTEYKAEAIATADSLRHGLSDADAKLVANQRLTDSLHQVNKSLNADLRSKTFQLQSALGKLIATSGVADEAALQSALNSVYYIRVEKVNLTHPNGEKLTINRGDKGFESLFWTGSGFLLDDGRFITARHVAEGYKYIDRIDEVQLIQINDLANSGGDVEFVFGAYSPNHSFSFTNKQCITNTVDDLARSLKIDFDGDGENETYNLSLAEAGKTDWACVNTSFKGNLAANENASTNLKQQTKLVVLGYPHGYYVDNVKALQGSCMVASDGLHEGVIVITERNFEHGNSGGPVLLVKPNGDVEVIGIISAGYGDTVGFIVPVANVK